MSNALSDATALAQRIKNKEITPMEAVEAAFDRIEKENDRYQAVHVLLKEDAYQQADRMTDLSRPFSGVPLLLKDLGQAYAGATNSSGSALLKDGRFDSTNYLVQKFLDAGFIVIGQTNVPEFGIKFISDSKHFGTVANPVNDQYHAGGSSGGAAAAVQTGMVPLAAGSDGGGSIRIPASFSGLIGLKPSTGRMPTGPASWRSWGGGATNFALTQSMRDTESLFMAMQTFEYDAMPFRLPTLTADQVQTAHEQVRQLKIAYVIRPEYDSPEAVQAVRQTIDALKDHGFEVDEVTLDLDIDALIASYYSMNGAEIDKIFSNIEKGKGRPVERHEVECVSWALREYGKKIPARDYTSNLDLWDQASSVVSRLHQSYDLLLHPATTHHAPRLDEEVYNHKMLEEVDTYEKMDKEEIASLLKESFKQANLLSPYALIDNLTGVPAISLPLFTCQNGLPLGLQFSSAKGREDLLLAIGRYLEEVGLFERYD